ncbi:hypothetical protein Misp01_02640 [Microtetraspora sp. NBRC 13810]|uniref:anticodon-binding protein n=1 Tax=Microtetraspora sp. NBRC 13810 TaxID=3030990 RepID=UPI0024A310DF|nr:anticodon-binding protein [Microtetraspora sp. NBRC 13810]GLW05134.1 hypothetical protein Misp01_02640 [Microtetraspora sp. NBRC 13810]
MTPSQLAAILGEPPEPRGSWEREALYVSAVALRAADPVAAAEGLAARSRALAGVAAARVRDSGFLEIVVSTPGELVTEIEQHTGLADAPGAEPADGALPGAVPRAVPGPRSGAVPGSVPGAGAVPGAEPWPERPLTWDNPGFVLRFAHARACAVGRWARDLGVPRTGFAPEALTGRHDRAVLRVLAELPGRRSRRGAGRPGGAVGRAGFARRLALAYHDAHERAPAVPAGEEPVTPEHVARVRLARAVRAVLAEELAALGGTAPDRL